MPPVSATDPLASSSDGRGRIIYVGDPMCSWCYGFAPVLDRLARAHARDFDLIVVVGGLRPGTVEPMDARMREFLEHHWDEVARRSGQPFCKDLLARPDFVYDTEPACRAVVTARMLAPEKTFAFFSAVQHAFYADNRDTGQLQTYLDLCGGLGIDARAFGEVFEGEEAYRLTQEDFQLTQDMGVRGFPTVLSEREERYGLLANGYVAAEELEAALERFCSSTTH